MSIVVGETADPSLPGSSCGSTGSTGAIDVGANLRGYRHGRHDPTTRWERAPAGGRFLRASWTPDGPGTVEVRWHGDVVDVDAHGPGAGWWYDRVDALVGRHDPGARHLETDPHPVVAGAARRHRRRRIGASGDLYHELLPTILEQRITAREAHAQWNRLCRRLGEPAPGPHAGLLLPPHPRSLARRPGWWFHPLGIERRRAETLAEVARHAERLWSWSELSPADAGSRLRRLRGVGAWTVGSVLGPALGDADAVPVGDYHAKNVVAWALAGEPRGTDDRMLELLAPYAGDRGRVLSMISAHRPPKFGPRQRILPMARW
jgi:hypothetical protein